MGISLDVLIAIVGVILTVIGTIVVWVRNHRFPRTNCFLTLIILCIAFVLIFVFGFFPLRFSSSTTSHVNSVFATKISGLTTEIRWPTQVVQDQSFVLEVSVLPTSLPPPESTSAPGQQHILRQLTPVGTPDRPISQAFGPKFDAFASADVKASAFDISPQQQIMQSLDQNEVDFFWTLTPRYSDDQKLRVDITGIWKPKGGGEPIERPLSGQILSITVLSMPVATSASFFAPGQLTLSDLFVALLGSALNVPWIVELARKRKESKKETQPAPTPLDAPQQPDIPSAHPTVTRPPA